MRKLFIHIIVTMAAAIRSGLELSYNTTKLLFVPGFEKWRWNMGKWKAYVVFLKAKKGFLRIVIFGAAGLSAYFFSGLIPDLSDIPAMDKENYIKKYRLDEKCKRGRLPTKGVTIDESSGSTGIPSNWVRSSKERKANQRMMLFGLRHALGNRPKFIINAFALGPWATGINISLSFANSAILKSLGPDSKKIENTLSLLGAAYEYVIMGYPPFLKGLADSTLIDWSALNVSFIYGGEGMSEPMRSYLQTKGIKKVYGSLGASDLELNIGAENDFTIALRRLLISNKTLAAKLLQHPGAMPMIFQYHPADFYIETNKEGELLFTLCRPYYLSPKIRYNIHDKGHVVRMPQLKQALKECGLTINDIGKPDSDLPLLFHYGRSDMSVAYFGSKLTPADIQEVVFNIPELAESVASFTMVTYEDEAINKKLVICFELTETKNSHHFDTINIGEKVFTELQAINQDFKESYRIVPENNKPEVRFYSFGTGYFSDKDMRIKLKYIINNQPAATNAS